MFSGNRSFATYKEVVRVNDIEKCVFQCCLQKSECNVAFMSNGRCYHVQCASDEHCLPVKRAGMEDKWKMVLVNPTTLGRLNLIKKNILDIFCGFHHNFNRFPTMGDFTKFFSSRNFLVLYPKAKRSRNAICTS